MGQVRVNFHDGEAERKINETGISMFAGLLYKFTSSFLREAVNSRNPRAAAAGAPCQSSPQPS